MGLFDWLSGRGSGARTETKPTATADQDEVQMRYLIQGEGDFDFEIVGESHYQDILSAACGGRCEDGYEKVVPIALIPDPGNAYDRNAIRVVLAGHTVGHLSRDDAESYQKELADYGLTGQTVWCHGMIVGGWERPSSGGKADTGSFGVMLDIDMPLEIRDTQA